MYACCCAACSGSPTSARAARTAPTYVIRASADQALAQVVELAGRVVRHAAVHRTGLEHGAPRRLEEAEALAERLSGRLTRSLVAVADEVDERERLAHLRDVDPGVQRAQPVGVDVAHDVEEVGGLAVQHDADVEELLAVRTRHAAQHDVLVGLPHPAPPGSHWRVPSRATRKST